MHDVPGGALGWEQGLARSRVGLCIVHRVQLALQHGFTALLGLEIKVDSAVEVSNKAITHKQQWIWTEA